MAEWKYERDSNNYDAVYKMIPSEQGYWMWANSNEVQLADFFIYINMYSASDCNNDKAPNNHFVQD